MWHEFSFHVYSKQAFANWNNQTAYVMVNTDLSSRCISTCVFLFVARARAKTSNNGSIPVRLKVREVKWLVPYVPFLNFSDEEVKQKGLDNIILGWGLTGALTSLLMVSPFAWILPEMIQKFLFPQGVTSLLYLIVVSVCDILLDIGCVLAVSKICKCDFGKILGYHPFSKMLRHAYISSLTVVWAPCALGNFGWVFQHLCVAAFETACWFGAWHDKESAICSKFFCYRGWGVRAQQQRYLVGESMWVVQLVTLQEGKNGCMMLHVSWLWLSSLHLFQTSIALQHPLILAERMSLHFSKASNKSREVMAWSCSHWF